MDCINRVYARGVPEEVESRKALLGMGLSLGGEVYGKLDWLPNLSGKLDWGSGRTRRVESQ